MSGEILKFIFSLQLTTIMMDTIPLAYRLLFLYIEPLAAFFGVFVNLFDPIRYLQSLSPTATPSFYSPTFQPIFDQVAAHLVLFAWTQAAVLRSMDDILSWKRILFGMLLCDLVHLFASYRVLGPGVFFDQRRWRWEEWINLGILYRSRGLRLAFCLGIGLPGPEKSVKKG